MAGLRIRPKLHECVAATVTKGPLKTEPKRARLAFARTCPGNGAKVPDIGKANNVAGLLAISFKPRYVLPDLAKSDQNVNLRLCIGDALHNAESFIDILFALFQIFAVHLKPQPNRYSGSFFACYDCQTIKRLAGKRLFFRADSIYFEAAVQIFIRSKRKVRSE
jgi:hypothetical protein